MAFLSVPYGLERRIEAVGEALGVLLVVALEAHPGVLVEVALAARVGAGMGAALPGIPREQGFMSASSFMKRQVSWDPARQEL